MWIITYKAKPITLERLYTVERDEVQGRGRIDSRQYDSYIVHKTRHGAVALYLYHFGFTWAERAKGVDVKHVLTAQWGEWKELGKKK